jgi:transcriptional regulator with XRE-family HTH domain
MPHQNNQQPGELLKLLRNLKGIKQDEAARKLGVRQQAISKLEKCKNVSSQKFDAIIAAFKFSAEDIETAKRFLPPPPIIFRAFR